MIISHREFSSIISALQNSEHDHTALFSKLLLIKLEAEREKYPCFSIIYLSGDDILYGKRARAGADGASGSNGERSDP